MAQHGEVVAAMVGVSAVLFVVSVVAVPWVLVRLRADYFVEERPPTLGVWAERPAWMRWVWRGVKNGLGLVLVLGGVLMLVLPGQGLLTLAVGLGLLEFPGKRRLERWLVSKRAVHGPINGLRRRLGRGPLLLPRGENEAEGRPCEGTK